MIYIKVKNEFGNSYLVCKNVSQLNATMRKKYFNYQGKTINDALKLLNGERISTSEYHKVVL